MKHFSAIAVIAVYSTLLCPVPFPVKNKDTIIERIHVLINYFTLHEEKD